MRSMTSLAALSGALRKVSVGVFAWRYAADRGQHRRCLFFAFSGPPDVVMPPIADRHGRVHGADALVWPRGHEIKQRGGTARGFFFACRV